MNSYDLGYVIGVSAGAAIGFLLVVVLLKFSRKDRSLRCKFDERQELIRGRGFKYGFFTLLIYEALNMAYGGFLERIVVREVIMAIGMLLGVTVYASYAIWKDGYFSLNERPRRVVIIFAVLSIVNILLGLVYIWRGDFWENGVIDFPAVNLAVGLMLLFVLVLLLVKRFCGKEADEGQEDK